MLNLRDYRIVRVDSINYTIQVYRTPEGKPQAVRKWLPLDRYFSTVSKALEEIKRDLLQAQFTREYSIEEFKEMLQELQEAIDSLSIKIELVQNTTN